MLSGGYNNWLLYRVTDTGSAYAIKTADGSAVADATDDVVIALTKMEDVKLSPKTDGSLEGTFTQYQDDAAFDTFLDNWATPTEGTTSKEVKFIDGTSSVSSGSTDALLLIAIGPVDAGNNSLRKTYMALVDVAKDSGEVQFKDGEYLKPSLKVTSRKPKYDLSIAEALFPAAAYKTGAGGIGAQTLSSTGGKHFKRASLKSPAST